MATVTRWSVAVVLAAVIGLGAPTAWAANVTLQDGTKAIVDDNRRLFLLGKDGKQTLAKDGTYQTKDGGAIIVQRGAIVQRPGAGKGSDVKLTPGATKGFDPQPEPPGRPAQTQRAPKQ